MAKRTRAPARRGRTASRKSTSETKRKAAFAQTRQASLARRRIFTPECLAYMRQRFEHSEESLADIGAYVGIPAESVRLVASRERWKRFVRPPHGLPPAVKHGADAAAELQVEGDIPLLPDTVMRLHRAVLDELAAIETLRARSPNAGNSARTARTLANLTETLQKLQRLQPTSTHAGPEDADMPSDIDEFRNELARRIEIFVTQRTDAGAGGGGGVPAMDAEV